MGLGAQSESLTSANQRMQRTNAADAQTVSRSGFNIRTSLGLNQGIFRLSRLFRLPPDDSQNPVFQGLGQFLPDIDSFLEF